MRRSGLSAGRPAKTVIGARLPKPTRMLRLNTDCTIGSTNGHSFSFMQNSQRSARQQPQDFSAQALYNTIFLGGFGAVK